MYGDPEYIGTPRVQYDFEEHGCAQFLRICHCGRFVKAGAAHLKMGCLEAYIPSMTAHAEGECKIHGVIQMPFEGWF